MEYTVIINGQSYDLPKKTLTIAESLDDILKVDSVRGLTVRQKFEKLHVFVKSLIGDENAKEIFGSDNLADIDLSELTLAVREIIDSYDSPVNEYRKRKNKEKLEGLPIDKIVSVAKAAETIDSIPNRK